MHTFKEMYNPLLYTTEQLRHLVEVTKGICPFGIDYRYRYDEIKKHYERRLKIGAVDYVDWHLREIRIRNKKELEMNIKKTKEEILKAKQESMARARAHKTTPGRKPIDPEIRKQRTAMTIRPEDIALLDRLGEGKGRSKGLELLCEIYRNYEANLLE